MSFKIVPAVKEYIKKMLDKSSVVTNRLIKSITKGDCLDKYDKTCKYFSMFYEKLFNDIGLHDFHKQTFVYNIKL